jgi:hypothetical protein
LKVSASANKIIDNNDMVWTLLRMNHRETFDYETRKKIPNMKYEIKMGTVGQERCHTEMRRKLKGKIGTLIRQIDEEA